MSHEATAVLMLPTKLDYSLTGENSAKAIERGLAEADWYQCPIPRPLMRKLLERRDGPAIRDTIIWFALIIGFGYVTYRLWPSWWAVVPYLIYAVLYASTSDSRWHESGHGTAFKTDWMNNVLYEIASFMVMRESTVWRWSHTRHHSDTIIVGRDPEIAVPRPPDIPAIIRNFFNLGVYPVYYHRIVMHSFGKMAADEKTFIPESEFPKVYRHARIYLAIYATMIVLTICTRSILPLLLVGLSKIFGSWLMLVYGLTQHYFESHSARATRAARMRTPVPVAAGRPLGNRLARFRPRSDTARHPAELEDRAQHQPARPRFLTAFRSASRAESRPKWPATF
jgi:fatty acid desaturase